MTGYIVEKLDLQTGVWRRAATSKVPQCSVDCLEEFKEYKFRVFAENFIGISEAGPESDKVLTREHVPDMDYDELCKMFTFVHSFIIYIVNSTFVISNFSSN